MFVVSCINMDLVLYGWIKVWEKWTSFYRFPVKDLLFVDGKNGIPMLRLAIDLMFIGHFAPFMIRKHLKMNIDRHLKFIMTRFQRVFQTFLYIITDTKDTDNDLICPLCRIAQETELHFVLCCPVPSSLRVQFISSKFYKFPNLFRLSLLLASTNENTVRNLSVYLYKAFKLRSILSS